MRTTRRATPSDVGDGGVFFLYGEDAFRKENEARSLVDAHLDPATKDFNLDILHGSEVDVETLASVLATPPMMAERRVVVLREVEALAGTPKARDTLLAVAKAPPSGLALILVASIPGGSSAKFYKDLQRLTRSVEFRAVEPNDVPAWLVDWAATRHQRTLTEEAARALGSGVGTDLGVLAQEVDKLDAMVEEGRPIDLDAVIRGGTRVPSEDRWVWMDRVGRREFQQALKGLGILFMQGESGVGLTIGLATHLIRLALVRTSGPGALEAVLPPRQKWLAKPLARQARLWTEKQLEDAILGLRRVDRILKSSSLGEEQVLEEWLLGLLAEAERGRA